MRTIRTPFQQSLPGYLIAIGATATVAIIRLTISDTVGNFAPVSTFTVAVVIAAWYGGLGPGLLATVLSGLAADYLFTPERHSFRIAMPIRSVCRFYTTTSRSHSIAQSPSSSARTAPANRRCWRGWL